ncbi:hypothetical protein HK099_000076 [Clydaea vesicula]|uniref:Mannosyltransferase n=1 Tax=Clydaea vesicula TaxID=447962 RepID=A0AAD5U7Y2_9FUNG|nr:hypothetical protein HK099_000076 [Clydaea vesicula]
MFFLRIFPILLIFRIINSFLIKTFHDPDEYYQSQEIAHFKYYGYGFKTWEWSMGLRSFIYPNIFFYGYSLLNVLHLDETPLFVMFPRLFQAFFNALTDSYTYFLAYRFFGKGPAKWALLCSLTSWFNFFSGSRTYSNNMETLFTLMAFYCWPWPTLIDKIDYNDFMISLVFASISCIFRPTSAIIWIFIGLHLLFNSKLGQWLKILAVSSGILSLSFLFSLLIDYGFYQKLTFVPWNFLKFNLIEKVSTFYGTHPWHWYISQGIPLVGFTHLPFAFLGVFKGVPMIVRKTRDNTYHHAILIDKSLFHVACWITFAYSLLSHKEFRFVSTLLPIISIYSGCCLYKFSKNISNSDVNNEDESEKLLKKDFTKSTKKNNQKKIKKLNEKKSNKLGIGLFVLVVTNVLMGYYFCLVHQRGVVDVIFWLRRRVMEKKELSSKNDRLMAIYNIPVDSVLILMPCHSTPFQSVLHSNEVSFRFLTCEPPIEE